MSRALNLDAAEAHVLKTCADNKAGISAIEPLTSGGTRVVFLNSHDAAVIGKAYGKKVLTGPVTRKPLR